MRLRTMILATLLCTLISSDFYAQTTSDFESFGLSQGEFLDGSDGSMGFSDGNIRLLNSYDDTWGSWTGWAISADTDTTTPGYLNQYSSITGSGHDGSDTYATAYVVGESLIHTTGAAEGGVVEGFYINNATYPYLSMQQGDAFAKRFGGEDGTDSDYFFLSIKEYGRRNVANDSIIFYLADFRSDDPAEDYIVDEWTYIDLNQFENVDTLSFRLYSSDVGMFGMNTPAYFCIDNFVTADMSLTATQDEKTTELTVYPTPAIDRIFVKDAPSNGSYEMIGMDGRVVLNGVLNKDDMVIHISELDAGAYSLVVYGNDGERQVVRVVKG